MLRQTLAVALGVALLAGMGGHADAAKAKKMKSASLTLRGCTYLQIPACTMINSGGKKYALVWTTPPVSPVPPYTHMTVTGQVTPILGVCHAPVVRVLSWKPDPRLCPK